jgi:hypothetical protein
VFSAFQSNAFQGNAFQIITGGLTPPTVVLAPNGNRNVRREYQPTYYELKNQRDIERKFQEAELSLKVVESKIEDMELMRLRDLADRAMQMELLALLSEQHELKMMLEQLQQQKLKALQDDDDFVALLMCLN